MSAFAIAGASGTCQKAETQPCENGGKPASSSDTGGNEALGVKVLEQLSLQPSWPYHSHHSLRFPSHFLLSSHHGRPSSHPHHPQLHLHPSTHAGRSAPPVRHACLRSFPSAQFLAPLLTGVPRVAAVSTCCDPSERACSPGESGTSACPTLMECESPGWSGGG